MPTALHRLSPSIMVATKASSQHRSVPRIAVRPNEADARPPGGRKVLLPFLRPTGDPCGRSASSRGRNTYRPRGTIFKDAPHPYAQPRRDKNAYLGTIGVRIRTGSSRQYTHPREQRRLLLLVFLIGGAVLLATSASQWVPRAAELLRVLRGAPSEHTPQFRPRDGSAIDTRLLPLPDEQSTQPLVSQTAPEQAPAAGRSAPPTGGSVRPQPKAAEEASSQPPFTTADIDFSSVQDDQPFRSAEAGPWFAILSRLRQTEERTIAAASRGWVTFSQLYRRSHDWRGRIVTVKGRVVQVARMRAPKNDVAISEYYQVWFRPADENNPLVVYVLSLPPGFPTGKRLDEPAEVHGVFFKRWAYQAHDSLRAAPVLLAKEMHWEGKAPATEAAPGPNPLPAVVLAVIFAGVFVWYVHQKTRPKARSAEPRDSP